MILTSHKRQQLKAQAHHLHPVILLGSKGLTANVLTEINLALTAHELIKIKIPGRKAAIFEKVREICKESQCTLVQVIGNISIVYRKN